jgi:hypothetical protein
MRGSYRIKYEERLDLAHLWHSQGFDNRPFASTGLVNHIKFMGPAIFDGIVGQRDWRGMRAIIPCLPSVHLLV